jgi:hypothetical protein
MISNTFFPKLNAVNVLLAAMLLFVSCFFAKAQSQEKMYSTVMLNFAKGIEWPQNKDSESFVIGVYEYPPLATELRSLGGALKAGSKKIEVRDLTGPEQASLCNILFVPAYKVKLLPSILKTVGDAPTLIITNKFDMAKKGSGVNFLLVNGKLQYEINCKSIEGRGMKIPASIKGLGIIVEN